MDYLLKASGLVILLFLFYYFFLKNETFFKSIRSYFLIGLIIVVAIPLVEIPIYVEQTVNNLSSINFTEIPLNETVNKEPFNWVQLFTYTYLLGVVIFCLKFLIQLISLGYLLSKHQFIKQEKYYYIETSKNISPFSFFNIIIYNKNQFSIDELEQIINHEKAHVLQWHSVDTILAHLLVVTLWFNPFVWLYRKAVQQNLEFLADAYALEMAENQKLYKLTLLKTYSRNYCTEITNNFYNSLIKKRIIMLHKNRSKNKSQWKYAFLLPLLVGFIFTFNTKTVAQEVVVKEVKEVEIQESLIKIINKDFQKNDFENLIELFKENGITLKYSNLKYNNANEIIKLTLKIKNKNISGSATWESEGNTIPNITVGEINGRVTASSSPRVTVVGYPLSKTKVIGYQKEAGQTDNNEVIEILEERRIDKKTELIFEEPINASEHVYIIESDGTKGQKTKVIKKQNSFTFKSDKEKPLVFINGKESSFEIIENITPDSIESISVLKGIKATEKYGDKAKNGAIEVTTKKQYSVSINIDENDISSNLTRIESDNNPIIIVNGKEVSKEEMNKIPAEKIYSINVLKGDDAAKKYGEKGENGVIIITLKKE